MILEKSPIENIEVAKKIRQYFKEKIVQATKGLLPVKIWQVSQAMQ